MALNVPWDTDLTKGRFYTAVNRYDYQIKVTQILHDSSLESEFLPLKRTIKVKGGDSDLRESFFEVSLGNHAELSVGKIRNAWGVSELFSPPVAVLPSRDDFTSLVPSKVDFLEAQNQLRLTILPTDKIEIELIAFDRVKNNKSAETNFQETLLLFDRDAFDDDVEKEGSDFITRKLRYNRSEEVSKNRKPRSARVIFYPRWGQFGFTHYKGLSSLSPLLHAPIMGEQYFGCQYIHQ